MDGLKIKFHLRHTDAVTGCGRDHTDGAIKVCMTDEAFRKAITNGRACGPCKEALRISDLKVRRAYAAYVSRLVTGATHEEAIRNTRQEFDLTEREEEKLLSDYAADKKIEMLAIEDQRS
jgi:hypothetical protein